MSAGRLIQEQLAGTELFQAAVREFRVKLAHICLPLGSPASGYDLEDIEGQLDDWLCPPDLQTLEDIAMDLDSGERILAGETRNQFRLDLA